MGKIKASKTPEDKIHPLEIPSKYLKFSFEHVDFANEKFSFSDCDITYFQSLFDRLKALSSWTGKEFATNISRSIRSNPIIWDRTTEPNGFIHFNETLRDYYNQLAFEFSVSVNEHGRVHGFLIENVFYVIWFDPSHNLFE